jgi:hypothetical protein
MAVCMGRTLFPSMASIALPCRNKIEMVSKQLHLPFPQTMRWRKTTLGKWLEKSSRQSIFMNRLHWDKWKSFNNTTDLSIC